MALGETAKLIVELNLNDRLSGPMGRVNRSLLTLDRGLGQTTRGVGQVTAGLGRIGVIGATVAAGGFIAVARAAGDFEAQLNTINTIAKLSDEQLRQVGEGIRSTFRETGEPLEDLTAAYYDLLSAGVQVADAQGVLNTAVKLGIGGLATTAEAVDLLTTAINAYGLNAQGAAKASDIFAAAVRDGKVTVSEINASFADVAPLAAQYGIKIEEIGAAYAVLTARGVPATEVGTQFNRAIVEGLKPGTDLVKVLEGLGGSFEDLIRQKGLVQTLQDIREEAERQGVPFQNLFGRIEAYKFALATTGPNQEAFNRALGRMGESAGESAAQFAERQQGLNFQLAKLKALAQDAGITIGSALLPKLVPLVEKLNDFIQRNQARIADFGTKLADGFQRFADGVQKADFSGAIQTLKILGEVGKKVVDVFLSLPSGVQAAIISGAALNRLSGGLIGAGAGNIAGGLIKLVFERGASPANPLWVAQVGGAGAGGPGGAAAGGGVIRSLLGITSAAGLGFAIGNAIGKEVFYNPTIAPAVTFETGQVNRIAASGDIDKMTRGIAAIDQGIKDLKPDLGPLSLIPAVASATSLISILTADERELLQDQKQQFRESINEAIANGRSLKENVRAQNTWGQRLAGLASQLNSKQAGLIAKAGDIAARVNEARSAVNRGFSESGSYLSRIAGKNFSPVVKVDISNKVQINAGKVVEQITRARVATGTIPEFA